MTGLIKEARDAAIFCNDSGKRALLRHLTDEVQDAFGLFTVSCSREDMERLVAAWSRLILALNELPVTPTPSKGALTNAG